MSGSTIPAPPPAQPRIGRYHVKRVIASGGMGIVYEAIQEKPRRVVALKLLKSGIASPAATRRFEFEAQLLARLRHPGIAQIYEAGTHDGGSGPVPFFAMEYVPNARAITRYAVSKGLDLRARLELFASVCDAVHHGHQKGIIHRDLKPANVLVDSHGQVKIIDFGVARSTDSDLALTTMQTAVGQLIGTLQYMSPEQCEAEPEDIDIRSDVYSLGVLLYELLSDRLPYDLAGVPIMEAARIIRERSPARPSTTLTTLRGDVETILLKALQKDRERRYQSTSDLAEDIRRFLRGEPITAHPPSLVYHLQTFARRHRSLFYGAAAVGTLLLVATAISTSLYLRAESERRAAARERDRAREAEAESEAIKDFLVDKLLTATTPEQAMGEEITVEEALRRASQRIATAFPDRPVLRASIQSTIGAVFREIGEYGAADSNLTEAAEALSTLLGVDAPKTLEVRRHLADLALDQANPARAESLYRVVLEDEMRVLGDEDPETLETLNNLGLALQRMSRHAEAESLLRRAMDGRQRVLGEEDDATLESVSNLADQMSATGRFEEADSLYGRAIRSSRRALGEKHPSTLISIHNLATLRRSEGKYAERKALFKVVLPAYREVFGDSHPFTAIALENLVNLLATEGKFDEAEEFCRAVLASWARSGQPPNEPMIRARTAYGELLMYAGKTDAAAVLFGEAFEASRALLGEQNMSTMRACTDVGWALRAKGRCAEAEPYFRKALDVRRRTLGERNGLTLRVMAQLGDLLSLQGRHAAGDSLVREALRVCREPDFKNEGQTAFSLVWLGRNLIREGRFDEAEGALREALEIRTRKYGADSFDAAEPASLLGECLTKRGRYEEAESLLVDSFALIAARRGRVTSERTDASRRITELYAVMGMPEKALRYR